MTHSTVDARDLIQHAGFLRALGRRLLLSEHEIDEASQEAYFAGLTKAPLGTAPRRSWLASVFANASRQSRRTQGRRQRRERTAARPEQVAPTADLVERREVMRRVSDAVLALREPYRTALLLRFYEDLPPRAIAAQLDLPVETVKSQIKRALQHLRTGLDAGDAPARASWRAALLPLAGFPASLPQGAVVAAKTGVFMAKKTTIGWAAAAVAATALGAGGLWLVMSDDTTHTSGDPIEMGAVVPDSAPAVPPATTPVPDTNIPVANPSTPPATESDATERPPIPAPDADADADEDQDRRAVEDALAELVASRKAHFRLEESTFDAAVKYLKILTSINIVLSPAAREAAKSLSLTLSVDQTSVSDILDLLTDPHDLMWDIHGNVVYIDVK